MENSSNSNILVFLIILVCLFFTILVGTQWETFDKAKGGKVTDKKYVRGRHNVIYMCQVELNNLYETIDALCESSCPIGGSVEVLKLLSPLGDHNRVIKCSVEGVSQ